MDGEPFSINLGSNVENIWSLSSVSGRKNFFNKDVYKLPRHNQNV